MLKRCIQVFLFVLISSCSKDNTSSGLVTTLVKSGELQKTVTVVGRCEALKQVSIIAPDDLAVGVLNVSNGQQVREGDVLCELDQTKALELVDQEQQKLNQVQTQIMTSEIRLDGLKKDIETTRKLYAAGAISLDQKDKQEQDVLIQENEFSLLLKQKTMSEKQLKKLEESANLLNIKANFDGVVTYVWTDKDSFIQGSSVKKGDLLFKISSEGKMVTRLTLREKDVSSFKEGQEVEISFPAIGEKIAGKVSFIDNAATIDKDSGVATFRMNVEFVPTAKVKPGMETVVTHLVEKKKNAIFLPRSAIGMSDGEYEVKVKSGEDLVTKKVKTGLIADSGIEILEGLSSND
jgi:membrane fusion protein, macrolide-specific efflux system